MTLSNDISQPFQQTSCVYQILVFHTCLQLPLHLIFIYLFALHILQIDQVYYISVHSSFPMDVCLNEGILYIKGYLWSLVHKSVFFPFCKYKVSDSVPLSFNFYTWRHKVFQYGLVFLIEFPWFRIFYLKIK